MVVSAAGLEISESEGLGLEDDATFAEGSCVTRACTSWVRKYAP